MLGSINGTLIKSLSWQRTDEQQGHTPENYTYGLPDSVCFVCGYVALKALPASWKGICMLAYLGPYNLRLVQHPAIRSATNPHWYKREHNEQFGYDPSNTYLTEGERFAAIAYPPLGVAWNVRQLRKVSYNIEVLANASKTAITSLEVAIESLAKMVAQNRLGLDFLFLKHGGLCMWLNQLCCFYVNKSCQIEEAVYHIKM